MSQQPFNSDSGFSTAGNVTATNLVTSGTGGNIALSGGNITGANVITANTYNSVGNLKIGAGGNTIAIGLSAGSNTQGDSSVAVGRFAGAVTQGEGAVAVGRGAGQIAQGNAAIAIGRIAGNISQGADTVAVGCGAGQDLQGNAAVAVGAFSGNNNQGGNTVAVGQYAGHDAQGVNAVAIGAFAGVNLQANNSIILNATGSNLDQNTANTFTVAPVRNDVSNVTNALYYNVTTAEISYGPAGSSNIISNGNSNVAIATANGNVVIGADGQLWTFDTDGNLTFPDTTVQTTAFTGVSVRTYGATGDGTTDDATAIQAAFNSNTSNANIYFPPGNYLVSTTLTFAGTNVTVTGTGARIFCTAPTFRSLLWMQACTNCHFEGLTFEITGTDATDQWYGVVGHQDDGLTDVSFTRCTFTSPNTNTNGVKFVAQTTNLIERVSFVECQFVDIPRMGIEILNGNNTPVAVRYRDVVIDYCSFTNIGSTGTIGYAVSLSGTGENNSITNNIFNTCILGVELVAVNGTTVAFNTFQSFNSDPTSSAFNFVGSTMMYRTNLIGNNMEVAQPGHSLIWNQDGLQMSNNQFSGGDMAVWFRTISNIRSVNDIYISTGNYAAFIEIDSGPPTVSTNNQFVSCQFSTALSTSNYAVFRTYGTGVTDTKLIACTLVKGTGGGYYDGIAGAEAPLVWEFGSTGNLTVPGNISVGNTSANSSISIEGNGAGNVLGYPSLLNIVQQDANPWAFTIQNNLAPASTKGGAVYVDDEGSFHFFVGNTSAYNASGYYNLSLMTDGSLTLAGGASIKNPGNLGNLTDSLAIGRNAGNSVNVIVNVDAGIAYNGSDYVAIGQTGSYPSFTALIYHSNDGITWYSQAVNQFNTRFLNVIWGNNEFIAVGLDSTVITSPDGITWTQKFTNSGINLDSVVWNGTQYVAVGQATGPAEPVVLVSAGADTTAWTTYYTPVSTGYFESVVWTGAQYVAVGQTNADSLIQTSPDGITWTQQAVGSFTGQLKSIAWSGSILVAGGANNTLLSSPDGITWTEYTPNDFVGNLNSITYTNNLFIASGQDANTGGNPSVITSSDGLSWTRDDLATGFNGQCEYVVWNGSYYTFAVVDYNTYNSYVYTNTNFITDAWTESVTTQGQYAVAIGLNTGGGQGTNSVAIGASAGNTTQGNYAVAIGNSAGQTSQGINGIAIGNSAGWVSQGIGAVAIGVNAGANSQSIGAVALGIAAGENNQGNTAVALGTAAGGINQGESAIAIGFQAGVNSQGNNSIILNATGNILDQTTANTFTVKPVRDGGSAATLLGSGFYGVYYNPTTGEFVYASTP
jgi:hypothetical protein